MNKKHNGGSKGSKAKRDQKQEQKQMTKLSSMFDTINSEGKIYFIAKEGGFNYFREKQVNKAGKIRWRCHNQKLRCTSSFYTDKSMVHILDDPEPKLEHNHKCWVKTTNKDTPESQCSDDDNGDGCNE